MIEGAGTRIALLDQRLCHNMVRLVVATPGWACRLVAGPLPGARRAAVPARRSSISRGGEPQ
jgi:hypothetical protein